MFNYIITQELIKKRLKMGYYSLSAELHRQFVLRLTGSNQSSPEAITVSDSESVIYCLAR